MAERTCGNCGAPARPAFLAPPAEAAPDLDGRPGEPARSSLPRWVQACPACHAAAPDLAALRPGPVPTHPDPFRRWAERAEGTEDAAEAWLWAAWADDDAGRTEDARRARRHAAAAWGDPAGPADALRRADVLRRAGDFAAADEALDAVRPDDEQTEAILRFARGLVTARDEGRQMLSSALRPPARRPHVSHGPAKRTSLWRRITGR